MRPVQKEGPKVTKTLIDYYFWYRSTRCDLKVPERYANIQATLFYEASYTTSTFPLVICTPVLAVTIIEQCFTVNFTVEQ